MSATLQVKLQCCCLQRWWQWALARRAVQHCAGRLAACMRRIVLRRAIQGWHTNAALKAAQRRLLIEVAQRLAFGALGRAFQQWSGHAQVGTTASHTFCTCPSAPWGHPFSPAMQGIALCRM